MENKLPTHIGIILDGNRRWAKENNKTSFEGHKFGIESTKKIVKYANDLGLKHLTLYAFSTENWKRSKEEVAGLMNIFEKYLNDVLKTKEFENVKVTILGDKSAFSKSIQNKMIKVEEETKNEKGLKLNLALNYGGRSEITRAAKIVANMLKNNEIKEKDITEELLQNNLYTTDQPDLDFVIRTSGEMRLSNFLPWQATYAELYFPKIYWPEFDEKEFDKAIIEYNNRSRRHGK